MEKESNSLPKAEPFKWTQIFVAIVMLFAVLICCILTIFAGVIFLRPFWSIKVTVPEPQIIPTVHTSPVLPTLPTEPPFVEALSALDFEADPLFGLVELQRAFAPDPFIRYVEAGGTIDTSDYGLDCGFTSSSPTFAFRLRGGASETFLRIFFVSSNGIDTTLVVHTPNQEWLCVDNSFYGNGMDPVIDIEFAASGNYAIWVGTHQNDTYDMDNLFITQSMDTTP